jgi:hypothetical protein
MAASGEDWSAWDAVASDGLESLSWHAAKSRVWEKASSYRTKTRRRTRR